MTTLYDQFGREVDVGRLKEELAAPTLAGIRNIYAVEHPAGGITPERLTGILREAEFGDPYRYLEFCEDIEERDLHYLAVLSTRKESVAQLEPMIKPPKNASALDQKIADFVEDALLERELWGTVGKEGISGRCVSIRCETDPFPAPLGEAWTKTGLKLAWGGRLAYTVTWNRRLKTEIPALSVDALVKHMYHPS
jgi:hypothetical protein